MAMDVRTGLLNVMSSMYWLGVESLITRSLLMPALQKREEEKKSQMFEGARGTEKNGDPA